MAAQASGTKSLKEYLKRYETNTEEEQKKKRKKKKVKPDGPGVLVVDEDPVWQKPVKLEEEEDNDSADEKPQVDEDIEVKRMRRLEQLRSRRPYNTIAEDGSGWVSLTSKADATEQNSDMSPPRRKRYNTPSPEPLDRPSDAGRSGADFSPPRRRTHHYSPSPEPHTRSQHFTDLNSDMSPPRKQRARNDTPSPDPSLKPRSRESNLSPVRRRKHHYSPSPGPDTKHKYSGSPHADLSPPRRQRETNYTSSPPARRKEDDDFSPPRQQRRRHYTPSPKPLQNSDMSPPRRSHAQTSERRKSEVPESGVSHPRRADHRSSHGDARTSLGSDLSPPRKRRMSVEKSGSPDFSSQHLSRHSSTPVNGGSHAPLDQDVSLRRKNQESSDPVSSKGRAKTGLITGHDIMEEISKTKKDDLLRFEQMDPSLSGRGAEPVFRDKKGQRISKEEYMKSKQKVEEKPKEKKLEWGKGLAQKREAEARLLELEQEKDKPFARTRDDAELDKMMKERVRWGDPMAHLVKNKHSGPVLADLGDGEKMKESGFIVPQEIPSHSWIKRGLDAAPNRYGIKPGRHWDGVDRSNGFEKKMFQRLNEKRATEREAYLWSVSDM